GSVAVKQDGLVDCAQGATVRLYRGADGTDREKMFAEEITDAFGDFKLDRLEPNSGYYRLEIEMDGYSKKIIEGQLQISVSLGTILLN
ncbi:MAG TPA: carboxypeptidase-like regulatory domain-containing protein, partial [Bacillota bacterium]|nr:carboxypeptidase-like regulatory domain-containing protein [Bacillota bacterium]